MEAMTEHARIEALVQDRVRNILATRSKVLPLLRETFTPNDPVHGLMHLPAIVKVVVDTLTFQRMRQIKQLGICALVYPGATHNRFFHSIGTCFLAYELTKVLRVRQPELCISDRDVLCVSLAGLCHDLGHPCFSHMFEGFVHSLGKEKREQANTRAAAEGRDEPTEEEKKTIATYESWTHEQASVFLLKGLFKELEGPFREAGLRVDDDGDDFTCIGELIDPPKTELEALLAERQLKEKWSSIIKGRLVEKAWMYEIVSNWRSGIDVDKFDYFRRDALHLGIQRQFDHGRYIKGIKVVDDEGGVPTISPPDKDKDNLRENMMELRKHLHRTAYQHKTVKKLEIHMIDILKRMDEALRVTGLTGCKLRMSEAAVTFDLVAYPKLTDTFVESRLLDREDDTITQAADLYEQHILRRQMMRLVADWDLPRFRDGGDRPFPLPESEEVIAGLLAEYPSAASSCYPDRPVRAVVASELRSQVAKIHYGMGSQDPITRVVFHSTKSEGSRGFQVDYDAKPLRQKIFVFWNPPVEELQDTVTLQRLTYAFYKWAQGKVSGPVIAVPASPSKLRACRRPQASPSPSPSPTLAPAPAPAELVPEASMAAPTETPAKRARRTLKINASCPVYPDP
mmetsp:Transcript_145219/g.463944  ORF Transcript_145219/g.463944 Transcript_145219/m.463944 type:complete len:626 (+) Transcript_145219:206-2083(+)